MTLAARLTEIEEAHIDAAFLAMSKLRDQFVHRDANSAACRIDAIMEELQSVVREVCDA